MKKIKYLSLILTFVVMFCCGLVISPQNEIVVNAIKPDLIKSKAYCLMDSQTGEVLLENNSNQHLPIASVTKTMTLLLVFEAIEQNKFGLNDLLLSSKNASGMGGSQVFLEADTKYKADDLLYAVVMSSANDASVVFAEEIAGSEDAFVDMMNDKAKQLGLTDTHFSNCTGLPANDHYSSAKDVALIMRELIKYPAYFNYTKERLRDFVHPTGRITQMTNTNKLINAYKGCDAGKTGSTVEAGYCLSATAMRNNMRLISVVLGADNSKQRFADCATIFDYGFNNYQSICLVNKDEQELYPNKILHAKTNEIVVKPSCSYYEITPKNEDSKTTIIRQYDNVSAPLKAGDVVGQIVVLENGVVKHQIDLILVCDVEQKTLLDDIREISNKW